MDLFVTIVLILVIGISSFLLRKKRPKNYPPSPGYGLPVVGHLIQLGTTPFKTLMKWKPVYGPMVSLDLGSFPTVAISDHKLIKEAFADWRFSGRPDIPTNKDRSGGTRHGLLFSDGEEWVEVRRFTMRHLRDFGFGKRSMETVLHEEVTALADRLRKEEEKPLVFRSHLNTAVLNSIWSMIASERFDHDDPQLSHILNLLTAQIAQNNIQASLASFIPWIAKYFPKVSGYSRLLENLPLFLDFLRQQLKVHREGIILGQPRDLMDVYIEEAANCKDPKSIFYGDMGEQVMLTVFLDLFIAGAETTSTTMTWFGLYMAAYPEVQEKLYQEILDVVGKSRLPSLDDRTKMPYSEAVLLEVMRMSSLVPMGLFHSTLTNVELGGYQIPKGTMILANLYSCQHDVEYWGDPEVFRPERFLASNGRTIIRHEANLPFSSGKRICLGENLARAELFIFSTTVSQRFQIIFDPKNTPETLEAHVGFVLNPPPHKLIFKERQN